jgi:lysophospholipase L1-like esterase
MTSTRLLLLPLAAVLLAGACGGDEMPPDTSLHLYEADDPNIQYTGRIDFTNPKYPRFALGATYITARFNGVGVSVVLKDEHRYGKWRNYYDAIVDGTVVKKIRPDDDVTLIKYEIANDLPYGEHVVTIVKRTEPNVGVGYFGGFEIAGTIDTPPPRPARKMLFFGDSITAGSGIEVPDGDPGCSADEWGQPVMNADLAYGAIAARTLEADYHVLGVSGIGLVRNYNSDPAKGDTRNMYEVQNLMFPEPDPRPSTALWPAADYQPDAIVVALGTNDFSPGPLNADNTPADGRAIMPVATYVANYIPFVRNLRVSYPTARVFLMSSPMLVDGWPTPSYNSKSDLETSLAMTEAQLVAGGDALVHKVLVSKVGGGCGTHPNVAGHAMTASELVAAVKPAMGW